MTWGTVALEPEVARWLEHPRDEDFGYVAFYIASGRRIVLLTVLRKTRQREEHENGRAEVAMRRCIAEGHTGEEHQ